MKLEPLDTRRNLTRKDYEMSRFSYAMTEKIKL